MAAVRDLALDRADTEVLLHRVVENSSDAILLLDDQRRVRFASSAAATLFRRSASSLVGRPFAQLLAAGEDRVVEVLEAAAAGTARPCNLLCLADGDGAERQVEIAATLLQGAGVDGWVVNLRDVSRRVAHERQLERSERRFRSLAEHVTQGMYQMSLLPEPRYDYVNPAMERTCGFAAEEFLADAGLTVRRVHPDDRHLIQRTREAPDEVAFPIELRWQRPSGEWVWASLRETVLHDESGRAVATIGIISDITARKQQEAALQAVLEQERAAAERLRRVDAMRTTFIQAVSHELRTPLTAITGYASTLRHNIARLDETTRDQLLERLELNSGRLDRMLADLLDVDRLASHTMEPNRREVEVVALVARVLEHVEQTTHRVTCTGRPVWAYVDAPKVERIVENLVRNAVKHTPPGSAVVVEVAPDEAGRGVVITVTDDGDGIPEDLLGTVFEPFVQGAASATSATPGMGIGLSLVARFAQMHGGRAHVDNRSGGGAAFEVWLPNRAGERQDVR